MAESKESTHGRHHYVPRFYLGRFADQKGRLRAFDRQKGMCITTSAKAVAAERDFYRLPENITVPANFLEEMLSAQESEAAEAIRSFVATGKAQGSHREPLILHLALQLLRTQRHRRTIKEMSERTLTLQAQIEISRRLAEDEFEMEHERTLAERVLGQLENGEIIVRPQEQALVGLSLSSLSQIVSVLRSGWNWILVFVSAAKFITSDNPICLLGEPESGSPASTVGVATALEIWFPLDPRHALVLSRDQSLTSPLLELSNGHVRTINLRIALESERWSFYSPSSEGVKGFQIPSKPPRYLEETIGHRDYDDEMRGELIRIGIERPRVPNERLLSGHRLKPFPR